MRPIERVEHTNRLFAQGARCGHLEALTARLMESDNERYIDPTSGEVWTDFDAAENALGSGLAFECYVAFAYGYRFGFQSQTRGLALSEAIREAELPVAWRAS